MTLLSIWKFSEGDKKAGWKEETAEKKGQGEQNAVLV